VTQDADATTGSGPRPIKSYKARQGRLSDLTIASIQAHWTRYGIGPAPVAGSTPAAGARVAVDLLDAFGGRPVVIEIGAGMGDAAVAMAAADPGTGVLAIEIHTRGVARTIAAAAYHDLQNLKVACTDADALIDALPDGSLMGVRGYFPDPWPKARHRKRRLFDDRFVAVLGARLASGGTVHLTTDIDDYADQMAAVLGAQPALRPTHPDGFVITRPDWRPVTKYERIALAAGRTITDLMAVRV
jgi:tRNA (guanine-N7-)-methyltransferase